MKKSILTIAFMLITFVALNAQHTLTVKIEGIESVSGNLYIGLYTSQDVFTGKSEYGKIIKVEGNTAETSFSELKEGKYALAIFQDENSNGKLDLGQYGIPKEKFAFSNNVNPLVLMHPPVFEDCSFDLNGDKEISVKLVSILLPTFSK